jgi:hypothetical protein
VCQSVVQIHHQRFDPKGLKFSGKALVVVASLRKPTSWGPIELLWHTKVACAELQLNAKKVQRRIQDHHITSQYDHPAQKEPIVLTAIGKDLRRNSSGCHSRRE